MRVITSLVVSLFVIFISFNTYSAGGSSSGGSGGFSSSSSSAPRKTPEQRAESSYNSGLKYRDKAWDYEKKAAEADTEKKKKKYLKKAASQYKKAIKKYRKAIEHKSIFYKAHGSLGYALRKTGDYEASLAAYDKALLFNPEYGEAIEYRAETYMVLNRLDDTKEAYMVLFRDHRELADQLMEAMQKWVEENRDGNQALSAERVAEFGDWVNERAAIAGQVISLNQNQEKSWGTD